MRRQDTEPRGFLGNPQVSSRKALAEPGAPGWKLFDADEREDLATEIRKYYIPDFSEWKNHDSYQKEFEKLLRDLRADEPKAAGA